MYEPLLFIHSWMRWIVLLSAVYFFFRSVYGAITRKVFSGSDAHFMWAFTQAILYQALFGIALWLGASPFVKEAFHSPESLTENLAVKFWTIRHPAEMLSAVILFFIAHQQIQKRALNRRFLAYAILFGVWLGMVVSAIPWPWLSYGRALFRGF